jgi:hypothetical protein
VRIHEIHWGHRGPGDELGGLVRQAAPSVPTVEDLLRYLASRRIHVHTRPTSSGFSVELAGGPPGQDGLLAVELREDERGVVAAMRFSDAEIDDVLGVQHGMHLVEGPSWDERREDWREPLPSPLSTTVCVGGDGAGASLVTFTPTLARRPRVVEVRFWRDRAAFTARPRGAEVERSPTDLASWR